MSSLLNKQPIVAEGLSGAFVTLGCHDGREQQALRPVVQYLHSIGCFAVAIRKVAVEEFRLVQKGSIGSTKRELVR